VHASIADWACSRQDDERASGLPPPGPVAEETCCGADPFPTATAQGTTTHSWVFDRSPPRVCRRDVIEVTHGLAAAANRGWSRVWRPAPGRRRSHSSRTLSPGDSRSEWPPGCWLSASPITRAGPVSAGMPLPELPCQGPRHRSDPDRRALRSTQPSRHRNLSAIENASARRRTPNRCPAGRAPPISESSQ
jgi:hypothetical protein